MHQNLSGFTSKSSFDKMVNITNTQIDVGQAKVTAPVYKLTESQYREVSFWEPYAVPQSEFPPLESVDQPNLVKNLARLERLWKFFCEYRFNGIIRENNCPDWMLQYGSYYDVLLNIETNMRNRLRFLRAHVIDPKGVSSIRTDVDLMTLVGFKLYDYASVNRLNALRL